MAIVVQQEKRITTSGILYILIWIIFILMVVIGLYYIFFKKPELYEKTVPIAGKEQNIKNLINMKSNINIQLIIQKIQNLKSNISLPQNIPTGKENPFF